jgi:hypothetical protein
LHEDYGEQKVIMVCWFYIPCQKLSPSHFMAFPFSRENAFSEISFCAGDCLKINVLWKYNVSGYIAMFGYLNVCLCMISRSIFDVC